ncbi:hypothetical protein GCM10022263_37220 [Nocardioides daeguensis]|uniref:Uncharacterized protein n=1 Tax=Nocardioides daeguensis TaxID=908359 RepID=A0ABP6WA05_9ACTN
MFGECGGEVVDHPGMGEGVGLVDTGEHHSDARGVVEGVDLGAGAGLGEPDPLVLPVRVDPFPVGEGVGFDDLGLGDLQGVSDGLCKGSVSAKER